MELIRVLIADDHPFFRDGLRVLLDNTRDTTLVGEASSGDEVVDLAATLQPDVILMDLKMPGLNGIDATRQIVQTSPHISILVVTMFEDDDSVFAALRAGARGYLLKGADKQEMLLAIRAVAGGEAILGPAIARRLMRYFAAPTTATQAQHSQVFPDLTDREREILALMAGGWNNQDIADRLVLSLKTVRNYVSNIFSKLQVADRAQAIIRAREAGFARDRDHG
jgi:DNA-binding NarL/FixJ family response regulator